MNKIAAFVLGFLMQVCCAQTDVQLRNMPPDSWGGRHAHLGYSAIMGFVAPEFIPNRYVAWGGCVGVGVWKEWKDYRHAEPGYRHGLFSRHDLQMDVLGCTLGALGNKALHVYAGPTGKPQLGYSWELK